MTLNERIKALRAQRAELLKKSTAISDLVMKENRLFTDEEQKTFDAFLKEVEQIDRNLEGLLAQERLISSAATPVNQPGNDPNVVEPPIEQQQQRGGDVMVVQHSAAPAGTRGADGYPLIAPLIRFRSFPGQSFTRYVMAIAHSKNNWQAAANIAKRWKNETPEVWAILEAHAQSSMRMTDAISHQRAAVASGTTQNATWAAPLVWATNMTSEFIELLRPETCLGKLSLRPIPFNVRLPRATEGIGAVNWVGEGLSKPVGKMGFDAITIPWAKMACIIVITQELARFSDPSAEMLVRDDLIAAMAQFKDQQFLDPTVAPVAQLKPGAITNGLPAGVVVPSTGSTLAQITNDVIKLTIAMVNQNLKMAKMVWIMTPAAKIMLEAIRTAQDIFAFPDLRANNTFFGWPVITANTSPTTAGTPPAPNTSNLILMDQSEVFYASDNGIDIETSTEASIQMNDAPATPPTPLVSFWQQNLIGIKAEEFNYWLRRRDGAVGMITGFASSPPT